MPATEKSAQPLRNALERLQAEQEALGRMIEQSRAESAGLVLSGNNLIEEFNRLKTAAEQAQKEKEAAERKLDGKEQQAKTAEQDFENANAELNELRRKLQENRTLLASSPAARSTAVSRPDEQAPLVIQGDNPETTQKRLEEEYAQTATNLNTKRQTLDQAVQEKNAAMREHEEAMKRVDREQQAVSQHVEKLEALLSQTKSKTTDYQQITNHVRARYNLEPQPVGEMNQITVVMQKLQKFVGNFVTPTSALFIPLAYHGAAAVAPALLPAALCCGPFSMCLRAIPQEMHDHSCVSQECVDCFGRIATKLEESKPFIAMASSLLMLGGALTAPVLNPVAISAMILFTALPMINKIFSDELTVFMGKDAYKATHAVLECVALSMFTHLTVQDMTEKPEMKYQLITLVGFFLNNAMTLLEIAARRFCEPHPPGAVNASHPAPAPQQIQ